MQKDNRAVNRFVVNIFSHYIILDYQLLRPSRRPLWQRLCSEMYWPAIHIPEAFGGLGLGFVELSILLEQMGRRLLCSPFCTGNAQGTAPAHLTSKVFVHACCSVQGLGPAVDGYPGCQFLSISTFLVSRRQIMPTIKLTPVITTGYHSP